MVCGDLNGKEIQKSGDKCIHIANSHYCTVGTNTTLLANYAPIQIKKNNRKTKELPITIWPSNSPLGYIPKRYRNIHSYNKLYINVLTASFIVALKWKQPKCSSTDKWMKFVLYSGNGKFSTKMEWSTDTTTWMNFGNLMLSETIFHKKPM